MNLLKLTPTIVSGTKIYTFKDLRLCLKASDYDSLMSFLVGQTVMPEGVYTWDYDRWESLNRLVKKVDLE